MARALPPKTAESQVREIHPMPAYSLDIRIDEEEGRLRIYDPRAFHAGRRAFCRHLLEAAAEHPALERAEVDLASSACHLEFGRGTMTAGAMAEVVTAAIRRASAGRAGADRRHWWSLPSRWTSLAACRTSDGVSWWEARQDRPGRVRLRLESPPIDHDQLRLLAEALAAVDGIEASHASAWSDVLTLDYRPGSPVAFDPIDAVEQARRHRKGATPPASRLPIADGDGRVVVATGWRRLGYLALAGGSFVLTVAGLIVPGIPTVPFLLATGYYLARSSPALNRRLRRMPVFGRVLVEWEQYHGLGRSSKASLLGLTAAIVVVTIALSGPSPTVLVVILVIASIASIGVARLPGIPDETPHPAIPRPARLALPRG